jgi:hypothetical protein
MARGEASLLSLAEAIFPCLPDEARSAEEAGDVVLARFYSTAGLSQQQAALALSLAQTRLYGENRAQLLV